MHRKRILLTGATGFVGRHLYPALIAAGHDVVCATRHPDRAHRRHPDREWARLDVENSDTIHAALEGCDVAYYLVHGIGESGNYPEREAASARGFVAAAEARCLERIVYLGGVLPRRDQPPSKHLESRRVTGAILRSGAVSTVELRAAMIIGADGVSWMMVRDLGQRLPAMLLPRWMRNHSHPVAIDDVVYALLAAMEWPGEGSHVFDLPGPERVSHRDLLERVAGICGHHRPMLDIPILSPRLSSYWIALITRVDLNIAQELVEGIRHDLDPRNDIFWDQVTHRPMPVDQAVRLAIADERAGTHPSPGAVKRARSIATEIASAA